MTKELEARIEELMADNRRLSAELEAAKRMGSRALASYQQRALQMEIIRQQNEDLDRLAGDLARAKRVEEERAREVLEAARLKSEFLANFSHEIRTPLNGIIGYCDLVVREEGSRLTPHGRRDLNVIKANAKTLMSLINDILDLSKIEAGRVDVIKERVDVEALFSECASTVREMLKGKEVTLTINIAENARYAFTDALKLRQITLNLLSNAVKFTNTGEIVLEATADAENLFVSVEDTGTGIPPDQLPFIFDKFRQVDGTSTRRVGGTGLGLAIVRELARVLGGTAQVTSIMGRGSRFFVTIASPADKARIRAPEPERNHPEVEAAHKGAKVLVVDDDPLVQQLLRGQLEQEGFEVVMAPDGITALRLIRDHRPATVILDVHLPRLDGWGVLTEAKSDPALAEIPIIILSVEEQRAKGFSLGACEYLVKPVEPEQLVSVVRRAMTPGTSGEVLIVDDDKATRELVARHLHKIGFSTTEASNGEEALLRARLTSPALIILDLIMPTMDGIEVLRRLRADGSIVPVVVLTGKDLDTTDMQILREGLARVVSKGGQAIDLVVGEAKRLAVQQRVIQSGRIPRVLYVEDSAQNRDIVRRYLQDMFDVIEAEDGEHGLHRAGKDSPDIILMDLSLPRVDGWETTRRIKADPKLERIPIIALTAHARQEDQERARSAGCIDYLTKPVERETLVTTILRHLKGETANV